ncbi:SoxR reducing system RseC family protein [Treponema primitia]|uniref:SoxR reducing system RseC family protein n=1 Tax=Treponema primitia TaxID=88058 RepID=UPI000255591F|nr:SoxR reducing system RseC family protein [Treponema primitia]
MTETGRIREIRGNTLTLDRENNIACFGCMNRECKAKTLSYHAENTTGLVLQPGQLVETEAAASALKQGLTVLLPPLLGFIAGYVLTGIIFPATGDPARAATGVLLLFATAFAVYCIRRHFPPKTICRVIREAAPN